jgi:hypothetical protein
MHPRTRAPGGCRPLGAALRHTAGDGGGGLRKITRRAPRLPVGRAAACGGCGWGLVAAPALSVWQGKLVLVLSL